MPAAAQTSPTPTTADRRLASHHASASAAGLQRELVGAGFPAAPVHHEGGQHALHRAGDALDGEALAALVREVRASAVLTAASELDRLATAMSEPIESVSLRAWPADFPRDISTLRRAPYESRADSVMYREVVAEVAHGRGWDVLHYGKDVEQEAARLIGPTAHEVLFGPREKLGPPWTKDHRIALAATIVASRR